MASCEKCWDDAFSETYGGSKSQPERYSELIAERKDNPCTPEQQASNDEDICPICNRKTIHRVLMRCVNNNCWKEGDV